MKQKAPKGKLIVVSGFSGVGKGTVIKKLRESYDYDFSVSATTRYPREGEINGVHYYFLPDEIFMQWISEGKFFEWAVYVGNYYGTPKQPVMDAIEKGRNVLLEIEAEGAFQIKEQYPEAVLIYMIPPSFAELRRRLEGRGTESRERIEKRLRQAILEEVEKAMQYDFVVVNERVEDCVLALHQITETGEGMKPSNCPVMKRLEKEALELKRAYEDKAERGGREGAGKK